MTLLQLEYYIEVCECKNITRAAQNLHVSQPALSKAMQSLENEYGTTFIIRKPHDKNFLTYEGQAFYDFAKAAVNSIREMEQNVKSVCSQSKRIRVGISILCAKLFPELISEYRALYPDVDIQNYAFGSLELQNYITNGTLDIVISGFMEDTSLYYKILLDTETYFWTNKSNPLSRKDEIDTKNDLAGENIGLFRESPLGITGNIADTYPLIKNSDANILFCTNQLGEIRDALTANRICTFLPKHVFDEQPNLVCIPTKEKMRFSFATFWSKENIYSYMTDFVDFAEEYISNHW